MKNRLSIALAVYNEEKHLNRCLSSVVDISKEIVIVDGGSTDRTIDIAKKYEAKIIYADNPPIFHINKQKAIEACSGNWILQLDADEEVPAKLKKEISEVIDDKSIAFAGFNIPRKNVFWGHIMKKTGVYPDYVVRLFRAGKGRFPCKSVHEQIEIDGTVGYLKNPLMHYSYETVQDYWKKAHAYILLTAEELAAVKTEKSAFNFIRYTLLLPIKTFFTLFIRNAGFVDGVYGFLFSLFSSLHFPLAYKQFLKK